MEKGKFIKVFNDARLIAIYFTLVYMWIASSHYLFFNVNSASGNASFYGGLTVIILTFIIGFAKQLKEK